MGHIGLGQTLLYYQVDILIVRMDSYPHLFFAILEKKYILC